MNCLFCLVFVAFYGVCHRQLLMCHLGFQQLYEQQSVQGLESPRQTVNRLVQEHKGTIEKVTVVGHSLGAGENFSGRARSLLSVVGVNTLTF